MLAKYCTACHNPDDPNQKAPFLKASTAGEVAENRGLWTKVALQLRNRVMPPEGPQPSEEDRFRIATWIEEELRSTACRAGDFAGSVTSRRLNRREYSNTIRDLLGVDLPFFETFPADGSGGEGFDNNGETLFLPPLLMERYLEAAQQILDAVVVTPRLEKTFGASDLLPVLPEESAAKKPPTDEVTPESSSSGRHLARGEELNVFVPTYVNRDYSVTLQCSPPPLGAELTLKIDGIAAHRFQFEPSGGENKSVRKTTAVHLSRGLHSFGLVTAAGGSPITISSLRIEENREPPRPAERAIHHRLFGLDPGEIPLNPRKAARKLLDRFLQRAFRRPINKAEVDRFMKLYERAAERGDPYEERVKLALQAVLVSSDFLFRLEDEPAGFQPRPISGHELASRLSYFLWSTTPDAELTRLAAEGRLLSTDVLANQADRMLDDPRSREFTETFIGQWLGTKDVGGRVAPTLNAIQHFYTPKIAADMRAEPILLFQHILDENRSLLELLDADYTFLTKRLAGHYGMTELESLQEDEFRRVALTDGRRGGVFGLGGFLAMTSHYKETSPVLRGAWVLETLLGSPVPTPPPETPALPKDESEESKLTARQKLQRHRENPSCAACHDLMDPIGFALENFDYLGRWRDTEDGKPIDASGAMPSGETFDGPAELRQVLLDKKDRFLRHITTKMLGYALGRSLLDEDQCTIRRLVDELEQSEHKARALVHAIVLSKPFRYSQRESDGDRIETAALKPTPGSN